MLDPQNPDHLSWLLPLAVIVATPMLGGCMWWLALRLRFPTKPAGHLSPYVGLVLGALMWAINIYMATLMPIILEGHPGQLWWRLGSLAMFVLYGSAFVGLGAYYLQMRRRNLVA
jgi:hypothetical protein